MVTRVYRHILPVAVITLLFSMGTFVTSPAGHGVPEWLSQLSPVDAAHAGRLGAARGGGGGRVSRGSFQGRSPARSHRKPHPKGLGC